MFCPHRPHFRHFFVKVSKCFNFLIKSFLGNFYRHLATFYWSHCLHATQVLVSWPQCQNLSTLKCCHRNQRVGTNDKHQPRPFLPFVGGWDLVPKTTFRQLYCKKTAFNWLSLFALKSSVIFYVYLLVFLSLSWAVWPDARIKMAQFSPKWPKKVAKAILVLKEGF